MAQQDTGLGWSAKGAYLMQSSGIMGDIVESQFIVSDGPTYSTEPSGATLFTQGVAVYDRNGSKTVFALQNAHNNIIYKIVLLKYGTYYRPLFVTDTDIPNISGSGRGRIIRCSGTDAASAGSVYDSQVNNGDYAYNSTYGLYSFWFTNWQQSNYTPIAGIPVVEGTDANNARNNALALLVGNRTSYYKLNTGYAVACMVKYNNEYGGVTLTPALISTAFNATALSTDGVSPCSYVSYSFLHDGMRFYMSMIPSSEGSYSGGQVPEASLTNFSVLFPQGVFNALCQDEWANIRILTSQNPYGDPTSGNEGGDGEGDTGDAIPFSTSPTTSSVSSGFLTLFMPNILTLNSLAGYMWSNPLFDPSAIKKLFADPMDAILSLHIVPVKPSTAGTKTISVAGIATDFSSVYTTEQFVTVNCGSIYIPKKFGSYLDYSPYTQTEFFLPFIGFRPVDIDDIQGKTVYLQYQVDILSGACIAELKASMDDANSSVIYSWTGNCAVQIPVTGADFKSAFATAITAAASLGAAVATGGAASPLTVGGLASTAVNSTGLKPRVQRSGAMIGSAGFMGQRTPFIVRSNPSIALPPRQEHFTGYPSFDTLLMSSLTGFNVIEDVHLEGVPATDAEMDEIERLLKGGVIF